MDHDLEGFPQHELESDAQPDDEPDAGPARYRVVAGPAAQDGHAIDPRAARTRDGRQGARSPLRIGFRSRPGSHTPLVRIHSLAELVVLAQVTAPSQGGPGAEFLHRVAAQVLALKAGQPDVSPSSMTTVEVADRAVPNDLAAVWTIWVDLGLYELDAISVADHSSTQAQVPRRRPNLTRQAHADLHAVALRLTKALAAENWPAPVATDPEPLATLTTPPGAPSARVSERDPAQQGLTVEQDAELRRLAFLARVGRLSPMLEALAQVYRERDRRDAVREPEHQVVVVPLPADSDNAPGLP